MRIRKPVQNGNISASSNGVRQRASARAMASAIGKPTSRQIAVETMRLAHSPRRVAVQRIGARWRNFPASEPG